MTSLINLLRPTGRLLSLLLISFHLHALPEDRDQPVQVSAERMEWHNQRQTGIYLGEVEASQGELRLESESLTLFRGPDGQLIQALAESSDGLAYMRDLPSLDEPQVEAWAHSIDYHPAEEKIILTGQAKLIQGNDSFRGHRLTYFLTSQDLTAEQAEDKDSRIEVILTPKKSGD